ncbi:MAG: AbrB/MazE/SpoVT family DNA-binding domain-containing protein [Thermomicrobiales bacterium]
MTQDTSVTSKEQVTTPREIRNELGIQTHDKIRFTLGNGGAFLLKACPSLEDVLASFSRIAVPLEKWDEIVEDDVARRYLEERA